ncbi:MAG: hypothetical protein ABJH07_08300 [Sedimentitalea sp.]|uniref:hypothetical protein n=1 Tax=Sedimentitalea sp. TaxID=2048915 RepID=UPI0032643E20
MSVARFIMVVILTLSASLSGAMDAGHMPFTDHDHAAAEMMADEQPACCQDSSERTQTCHAVPALLPASEPTSTPPNAGEDVVCASGIQLTGIQPSGLLDPPRSV